jgi:hypothetical protein
MADETAEARRASDNRETPGSGPSSACTRRAPRAPRAIAGPLHRRYPPPRIMQGAATALPHPRVSIDATRA